ncbi:MAG TPA: OmpA family protein, partial [Terriglobales bacterium]|nr:OmpA family protein [Terriglobales bacterium]
MKSNNRNWLLMLFVYACAVILVANHALAASAGKARQLSQGERAKVSGLILSRDGDLIRVHDKKSGEVVVIQIEDTTKVERTKYKFPFYRHVDMDATALLPGLNIEAEGVGNSAGQLDAHKISFSPDDFAIEVAEEQQVVANKAAAQRSEASADLAAKDATQAQLSADRAQNSADTAQNSAEQAGITAQTAGALSLADAAAVAGVNQRVSDLDNYKNEFEVDVFFPEGSTVLGQTAKSDLDNLADIAKSLNGYMIEISGYAAHHKFSTAEDQKLSEERAAVVARYFLEVKDIPIRRILVPVGYGATHPVANNQNAQGRDFNRHVDVKVL